MTLKATPEIMKDGVTCEVSNEHGTDTKTVPVSLKRGQCEEMTAMRLFYLPAPSPAGFHNEPQHFIQLNKLYWKQIKQIFVQAFWELLMRSDFV